MRDFRRREELVVELLLQGCDNPDISKQLDVPLRTIKKDLRSLFTRYGITDGVKRVKLATLLYRRQLEAAA